MWSSHMAFEDQILKIELDDQRPFPINFWASHLLQLAYKYSFGSLHRYCN